METNNNRTLLVYTALFFIGLIWSGIHPHDYFTWLLEVAPAIIAFVILAATFKRFRLSNFAYLLILIHSFILMIGGHSTYAEVPLFNWLRDTFDLTRNYYDRVGHFMQGFIPALILRETILRKNVVNGRRWQFAFITASILGGSAFYELIEWWTALSSGEAANAFLGTQGDIWDTQWDMFMCLIGTTVALLLFAKFQDRYLFKEKTG